MTDDISELIYKFLCDAKPKDYWRAIELHKELVGDGTERLLEMKGILEDGVDDGTYERLIKKVERRNRVGYRVKGTVKVTISTDDRVDMSGWERKEIK